MAVLVDKNTRLIVQGLTGKMEPFTPKAAPSTAPMLLAA
jgi:succinyl-CoA synthetase alpha subunit